MSAIRVHDADGNEWVAGRDFAIRKSGLSMTEEEISKFPSELLNSQVRTHEEGTENTLQLFESRMAPHIPVAIHSHATDEIIYVVSGSLELGQRSLGPGSSVFVAADTLYSFRSGPAGLQFLNFRTRKDDVYRNPEQHKSYMSARRAEREDSVLSEQ